MRLLQEESSPDLLSQSQVASEPLSQPLSEPPLSQPASEAPSHQSEQNETREAEESDPSPSPDSTDDEGCGDASGAGPTNTPDDAARGPGGCLTGPIYGNSPPSEEGEEEFTLPVQAIDPDTNDFPVSFDYKFNWEKLSKSERGTVRTMAAVCESHLALLDDKPSKYPPFFCMARKDIAFLLKCVSTSLPSF